LGTPRKFETQYQIESILTHEHTKEIKNATINCNPSWNLSTPRQFEAQSKIGHSTKN